MIVDTRRSPHAEAAQIEGQVETTGGLVHARRMAARDVMIPHVLSIYADPDSFFHEVENFRIAAGESEGEFRGNVYGDGDFYKLLEGCAYFGIDISEYAALIARAQEGDGYISTKQIIASRKGQMVRHADQDDFEEYNFGHLFTLACVHYRLTGDETLLDVAKKAADYLYRRYLKAVADKRAMTAVCPSHYMGLAELYRTTGEKRYLDALKMAIEIRDYVENGTDDNQDAIPLRQQRKMHGHAVRATYLYAGVADLYMETGDEELRAVLESCFENMVNTKMYITGGLGALYTGASPFGDLIGSKRVHQAFGYEYQLPNITAYNETCGALGGAFWASRMFSICPEDKYMDFVERVVYNLAMAAVNVKGDKYFYENMLRRTKEVDYFLMWPRERTDTFKCFCCPTNLSRFMAELPSYAFYGSFDTLYACLYMACKAHIRLGNGAEFDIEEKTDYPWDGRVTFEISNWNGVEYSFIARQPFWMDRFDSEGKRIWQWGFLEGRNPSIELDVRPRLVRAHAKLEENEAGACVMRGPVVYCVEQEDVSGLYLPADARFEEYEKNIDGERVIALKTKAYRLNKACKGLYSDVGEEKLEACELEFIPYFEWDNSGFKEMRIWIPVRYDIKER